MAKFSRPSEYTVHLALSRPLQGPFTEVYLVFFTVPSRIICRKHRGAPQSEEVRISIEGDSLNSGDYLRMWLV